MIYRVVSDIYATDKNGITFLLMNGDTLMNVKQLGEYVEANYSNIKLKIDYHDFNNKIIYRAIWNIGGK